MCGAEGNMSKFRLNAASECSWQNGINLSLHRMDTVFTRNAKEWNKRKQLRAEGEK